MSLSELTSAYEKDTPEIELKMKKATPPFLFIFKQVGFIIIIILFIEIGITSLFLILCSSYFYSFSDLAYWIVCVFGVYGNIGSISSCYFWY